MRKIIMLLLSLLPAAVAGAEVTTGNSAATAGYYLAIPAGARPAGLGNAFTGVRGDLNAIYWNPAGLIDIENHCAMLSHQSWIQGMNLEYVLYAQPIENFGVVGGAVNYLNYGAIERWTIDASGNPIARGDNYTPYALSGVVDWAVPVGSGIVVGAGLKLAYEQIDDTGSLAGAVDMGLNYGIGPDLSVGAVIRNLGLTADSRLLPLSLRLGGAYNFPYSFSEKDMFTLFADLEVKYDDLPVGNFGVEYTWFNLLQLRAGWEQNFGPAIPNRIGITGGGGLTYQNWKVDYAFAPQGDLGAGHRISVQYEY